MNLTRGIGRGVVRICLFVGRNKTTAFRRMPLFGDYIPADFLMGLSKAEDLIICIYRE
jgi:hypothetical protein